MKLSIRGWRRDHGTRTLVTEDLADVEPSPRPVPEYHPGFTYVSRTEDGDVIIESSAHNVSLNGNYQLEIKLSKDDIFALVKLALRDGELGEFVDAVAVRRKRKSPG